jgi:hypothetical protein
MDYNDYRIHLLTCEFLGKEPTGQYKKIHDFLTDMWDGMECIINFRRYRIVLHKGDEWYMEQDCKNGYLWCHHDKVWGGFQCMEEYEIKTFVKRVVEEYLMCTVGIPDHTKLLREVQQEYGVGIPIQQKY